MKLFINHRSFSLKVPICIMLPHTHPQPSLTSFLFNAQSKAAHVAKSCMMLMPNFCQKTFSRARITRIYRNNLSFSEHLQGTVLKITLLCFKTQRCLYFIRLQFTVLTTRRRIMITQDKQLTHNGLK